MDSKHQNPAKISILNDTNVKKILNTNRWNPHEWLLTRQVTFSNHVEHFWMGKWEFCLGLVSPADFGTLVLAGSVFLCANQMFILEMFSSSDCTLQLLYFYRFWYRTLCFCCSWRKCTLAKRWCFKDFGRDKDENSNWLQISFFLPHISLFSFAFSLELHVSVTRNSN